VILTTKQQAGHLLLTHNKPLFQLHSEVFQTVPNAIKKQLKNGLKVFQTVPR
jgi:hypothetical protein